MIISVVCLGLLKHPGYLCQMASSIWFNSSRFITKHFKVDEISDNDVCLQSNSTQTSARQGKKLENLLDEINCERQPIVIAGQKFTRGPFTFTILSPEEDNLRSLLHKWPDEPDPVTTSGASRDYGMKFEDILSNDKFQSDQSVYNGSSIAFILEADGKAMLFWAIHMMKILSVIYDLLVLMKVTSSNSTS